MGKAIKFEPKMLYREENLQLSFARKLFSFEGLLFPFEGLLSTFEG